MAIHIKPTVKYLNDLRKVNPHLTKLVKENCIESALYKKILSVSLDGQDRVSSAKISKERGHDGMFSLTLPKIIFYKIKNYFTERACKRAVKKYLLKNEEMWAAVRKALHPNNTLENVGRVIEGLVDQEKKAHKIKTRKRMKETDPLMKKLI